MDNEISDDLKKFERFVMLEKIKAVRIEYSDYARHRVKPASFEEFFASHIETLVDQNNFNASYDEFAADPLRQRVGGEIHKRPTARQAEIVAQLPEVYRRMFALPAGRHGRAR